MKKSLYYIEPVKELEKLENLWEKCRTEETPLFTLIPGEKGIGKKIFIEHFIKKLQIPEGQIVRLKWAGIFADAFTPFEKPLNIKYDSLFNFHRNIPGLPSISRLSTAIIGNVPVVGKILSPVYDEWLQKISKDPKSQIKCFHKLAEELKKRSYKKPLLIVINNTEEIPDTALKFFIYFTDYHASNILLCSLINTDNKYKIPERLSKINKGEIIEIPYIKEKDLRKILTVKLQNSSIQPEKAEEIINFILDINKSDYIVPGKIIELLAILEDYHHEDMDTIKHLIKKYTGDPLSLLEKSERRILELFSYLYHGEIDLKEIKNFKDILSHWGISPREYEIGIIKLEKCGFINKHVIETAYKKINDVIRKEDHNFICNSLLEILTIESEEKYELFPLLAYNFEQKGELEKAGEFYVQTALRRLQDNQNDEAINFFKKALCYISETEKQMKIKFYLSVALYKSGNFREAELILEDLLTILNRETEEDIHVKTLRHEVEFYTGLITSHGKRDFIKGAEIFEKVILESSGELKALAEIEFAWSIYRKNPEKAYTMVEEALKYEVNQFTKATGHHYKAIILKENKRDEQSLREAEEELKKALELAEDDLFLKGQIYNTLGSLYSQIKRKDEAIFALNKSIECKKEIQDMEGLAISYGGLARTYLRAGEYEKARENYIEDLNLIEKLNPQAWWNKCQIYIEISETYRIEGKLGKASIELEKCREIIPKEDTEDNTRRTLGYLSLMESKILCDDNKPDMALKRCMEAELHLKDNFHIIPEIYLSFGRIYRRKKDFKKAIDYFNKAEKNLEDFELQFLHKEKKLLEKEIRESEE